MSDQQPQFEAPQGYEPYAPGSYTDPTAQPAPYAQPTGQPSPYAQPAAQPTSQPSPYGQPSYGQSTPYGQAAGQTPYGVPYQTGAGYGQPQQGGMAPYGQPQAPGYAYGGGYAAADHPQTQTVFILGIIGIFTGITAFIAWYLGGQAKKEIEAGAPYQWAGNLKTGYMLGKIFSIITIVGGSLMILFYIAYFIFIFALIGSY